MVSDWRQGPLLSQKRRNRLGGPILPLERQPGAGPAHRRQTPGRRQRDVCRAQVRTAETDVGRKNFRHRDLLEQSAVGGDDADSSVGNVGDADVAVGVEDEVVRAAQRNTVAFAIEDLIRAVVEIGIRLSPVLSSCAPARRLGASVIVRTICMSADFDFVHYAEYAMNACTVTNDR